MTETVKKRKRLDCSIQVEENITESAPQGDNLNKELAVAKRNRYTFEEKKNILEECKTLNSRKLCVKYGLNRSVLSKWRSHEEMINNAAKTSHTKTLKKVSETNELDAELFTWLSDCRCKGIPVSGPMLCRQALVINSRIGGPENFKASHGWLEKWRRRTHIKNLKITVYKPGKLIIEGKTKKVFEVASDPTLCILISKDRITAGDGVKSHDLEGKAAISTATNAKVFELLNEAGLKTAFVEVINDNTFVSKRCDMVPIEWVTRRLATGSFLKRHTGVPEGFRFNPPLQETFFKDDANHDPQWSEEQIVSANFKLNGVTIGKDEYDIMKRTTLVVFEVLERAWTTRDCALVDMKIEFGIDANGEILVADIIDSDSWRLWPSGDKNLMKDKQVYRNLTTVTDADLDTVKRNFKWVANQLDYLVPPPKSLVVILMGSISDKDHCQKIAKYAIALGLKVQLRVTSAHKGTEETLRILAEYEGSGEKVVLIAVAGRSNGLGPVLSGNTTLPVINCPPVKSDNVTQDIWSSLNVPSGLGCTTVIYPESAALAAAQIHALYDHLVWSRLRVKQLTNFITLKKSDVDLRGSSLN